MDSKLANHQPVGDSVVMNFVLPLRSFARSRKLVLSRVFPHLHQLLQKKAARRKLTRPQFRMFRFRSTTKKLHVDWRICTTISSSNQKT